MNTYQFEAYPTALVFTDNLRVVAYGHVYRAKESDLKVAFGLQPKQKWPKQGMDERPIGNVFVRVVPLDSRLGQKPHRAIATCPVCERSIPAGRLAQHFGKPTCTGAKR